MIRKKTLKSSWRLSSCFLFGVALAMCMLLGSPFAYAQEEKAAEEKPATQNESKYGDLATCGDLLADATYTGDFEAHKYLVPGKDSWVFRSRQDLKTEFKLSEQDIVLYQKLSNFLKGNGTELVLVYLPTRGMHASQFLLRQSAQDKNYDAALAIKNYEALIKTLKDKGVHIVGDPSPVAPELYFNHADQHWTTHGARAMAEAVSSYIKANIPIAAKLPQQKFETEVGNKVTYDGRFGEITKKICKIRPNPESDMEVTTKRIGQGDTEKALLENLPAPLVTLVGTSNSKREEFNSNFAGYLKQELSLDIYNAAIPGGGMDDSLLSYLASAEYKKSPPRILIWEIPGYYDLGGAGMNQTVRQAMASVGGFCDKPLVTFPKQTVTGKKLKLFEKLDDKNIAAANAYIVLKFEEDVAKDFTMSVKTSDGKHEKYEFEKRREGGGRTWFYMPEQDSKTLLSEATISVKPWLEGLTLEARICPLAQ